MIGTTVGNYRIVERLGDGGMGAVFRAVDEMLDREVAIKVLRPELARNAALIERFRQEAIALARLNHPRIATLHGLERHGESFLMIMEYVRGETLETIVQRSGRLAWPRAAELCSATLDALDHAHDKGVVHRDIKPANIMLASYGAVKVMDFGIARLSGKNRQTKIGHAVGTPTYMAPEQLRGEEVDGRTDLYATGAVLFELVTGRMAFEADSDYTLMMMQLNDPPPSASKLVPEVPPAIDAIIARAMSKRREDRFPNAAVFRQALDQAVATYGLSLRTATPPDVRLAPPPATRLAPNVIVEPVPATRLVSDVAARGVPATRLAPDPSLPPVPQTRLAPDVAVPATRFVSDRAVSPAQDVWPNAIAKWVRDWRTYAVAGVLFVGAGLAVRMSRVDNVVMPRPTANVPADTVKRPAVATVASIDTTTALAAAVPHAESAQDLVINPPARAADTAAAVVRQPLEVPKAPSKPRTSGVRTVGLTDEKPPERLATVVDKPAVRDSIKQPSDESVSEADASVAIRDALRMAASSLSGRNTGAASVLIGAVQEQWIALMKEGRVSMSVSGSPQIQRNGARASAEFDASVNVRSPFGANRRQTARFSAEVEQNGSGWRVVTLRSINALDLK